MIAYGGEPNARNFKRMVGTSLLCHRLRNLLLTRNSESSCYRDASDAEQQGVAGILVAKFVNGLRHDGI